MTKIQLRKIIKELCIQNKEQLAEKSCRLCEKLIASPLYKEADEIFAYMPLADEVNLIPLIKEAIKDGKKTALPKITSMEKVEIQFYYLSDSSSFLTQTQEGSFGIKEPNPQQLKKAEASKLLNKKILFLVPGRAFTKNGDRLGRGKGFYDRYLTSLNGLKLVKKIGICFEFQLLPELPTDANDIKMDEVIYE